MFDQRDGEIETREPFPQDWKYWSKTSGLIRQRSGWRQTLISTSEPGRRILRGVSAAGSGAGAGVKVARLRKAACREAVWEGVWAAAVRSDGCASGRAGAVWTGAA